MVCMEVSRRLGKVSPCFCTGPSFRVTCSVWPGTREHNMWKEAEHFWNFHRKHQERNQCSFLLELLYVALNMVPEKWLWENEILFSGEWFSGDVVSGQGQQQKSCLKGQVWRVFREEMLALWRQLAECCVCFPFLRHAFKPSVTYSRNCHPALSSCGRAESECHQW